jgi:hypothetical protein
MEGTGAHFHVVGLQDDAALLGPEILELQDQVLEGKRVDLVRARRAGRGHGRFHRFK